MKFITLCAGVLAIAAGVVSQDTEQGDSSILLTESARANNQSLLWGPYRPNLYFGVRPRIPKSFMGSLIWSKTDNYSDIRDNVRSTCEQHDGFEGYGWDEYDIREGGHQTIRDAGNKIDLTTKFVKIPGGVNGGSWGVRIRGVPRKDAPPKHKTMIVFAATLEGSGTLEVQNERDTLGTQGDVVLEGQSDGLGEYTVTITEGKGEHPKDVHPSYKDKPLDRTMVYSGTAPEEHLWQAKGLAMQHYKNEIDGAIEKYGQNNAPPPWQLYTLPNDPGTGNYHLIQKVFEGPFEFDVLFSSGSAEETLTSQKLSGEIKRVSESFKSRFKTVFELQAPFDLEKYQKFAQSAFSNVFGGIGYFYGHSIVDRSNDEAYLEQNEGFVSATKEARELRRETEDGPHELFSSVPSRPFFPRGFLWDEGFHLLPISNWDMDLTLDIVKSWFSLIDEDGWIGREQILGMEARSRVPPEFTVQYPHYANPPTLFLILENYVDRLAEVMNGTSQTPPGSPLQTSMLTNFESAQGYLKHMYPLLVRQYNWFRRTQFGEVAEYDREAYSSKEAYRWRGRSLSHTLTSGLDDYPRATNDHPGELNVDLISWVGLMSRSLRRIATFIGEEDDVSEFSKHEKAILRNIDDLHWSEKDQAFCDATIDEFEESVFVCHKGYVSIFPFLTGNLPADSPRMGAVLESIGNPEELWSDYGLRSLSKSDEYFETGENYWRSPIWVNINFLALQQLLKVANSQSTHAPKAADLYSRLRTNLVNTIFQSWSDTGFFWEQYSASTGAGQRTQHFTGWTSLVVSIMAMPDIASAKIAHNEL